MIPVSIITDGIRTPTAPDASMSSPHPVSSNPEMLSVEDIDTDGNTCRMADTINSIYIAPSSMEVGGKVVSIATKTAPRIAITDPRK